MGKSDREETRARIREQLKRERKKEIRRKRIGIALWIAVPVLLIVALVALFMSQPPKSEEDFKLGDPSTSVTTPAAASEGEPYLEFGAESSKPVMDLYLDFTCPFCKESYEAEEELITDSVLSEDITLRVHPRTFLDRGTKTDYSSRAAIALTAVYEDNPEDALQYMSLLFENQPREGSAGLSNEELQELANEASSEVNVTEAIHNGDYRTWLIDTVETEAIANTEGTPYILVDGERIKDWRDSDGIREALGL